MIVTTYAFILLYDLPNVLKFEKITWKNILVIMKNQIDLIDLCIKYKPSKNELIDYIKNKKQLVLNKELELDDTLEELIKLKGVIL